MLAFNYVKIDESDFSFFQKRLHDLCGIFLTPAKKDLLQMRLMGRLAELRFEDFADYRSYLETLPATHEEWQRLINELTTNKTDFFREPAHFEYLAQEYLPEWQRKHGNKPFLVWSAACSTGEEPYTLGIVLDRYFNGNGGYKICASDIDTETLAYAQNGVYPKDRLSGIPSPFRPRAIAQGSGDIKGWGKVRNCIRGHVEFQQCNLIKPPYPWQERFDTIFCRNVFIYFKAPTIEFIVNEFYKMAAPGALLFIGHAETLQNIKTQWKSIGPSIFKKESSE